MSAARKENNSECDGIAQIVLFTKKNGPLTKSIKLAENGSILTDGSACTMGSGRAARLKIDGIEALAVVIAKVRGNQAIALGSLRADLPDEIEIVTKAKLNGDERPDLIARTGADIVYKKNHPAFALLDYDTKGMPPEVAARLEALGSFWSALATVIPALGRVAHVLRRSTSAGLLRSDTGEDIPGSNGLHGYIVAREGSDIPRFLTTLHERCWLAGLGWMMVGASGQLLERSIVDRMVGAPERLVFEGPPVLKPPLKQDTESRRPIIVSGEATLDTLAACPPLTLVEQQALKKLKAEASQRLHAEMHRARQAFVARQAAALIKRTGLSKDEAARVIDRQCRGILLPDITLMLDDHKAITVADVLADPAAFEGCTLADPIEGIEYGRGKAKILRRSDGSPWIHSFAHGRACYDLKYDFRAVGAGIEQADDPASAFVKFALAAELDPVETKRLIDKVAARAGIGVRPVVAQLKQAKQEQARQRAEERREQQLAQRNDPRPQLQCPAMDAPWLPQMQAINEVAVLPPQPRRNIEGTIARKRRFPVPNTHAFSSNNKE